jgi:hypothetical protein
MKLARIGFSVLLVLTVLTSSAWAFTGKGWLPDYSSQLGLRETDAPAINEDFSQFETMVEDPLMLKDLAKVETEAGVKVTVSHAGNMRWGIDVEGVSVKPAAIRLKIEGQEKTIIFLPDKETAKLKLYDRPPFRSSAVPRKAVN